MSKPSLTGVKQFSCSCNAWSHCYLARLERHCSEKDRALTTRAKLWLMILTAHRKTALRNLDNCTMNLNGITYYFYATYNETTADRVVHL